ncbi:MAG: hypothetical protein ACJ72N_08160 [Labedaea sp.]
MTTVDDRVVAELPPPDTGSSAAADPVITVLLAASLRLGLLSSGLSALMLAGMLAFIVAKWHQGGPLGAPVIILVVIPLGYFGYFGYGCLRFARDWRICNGLLSTRAWRPVPAAMVTGRVVELRAEPAAGQQVRVTALPRCAAEVLARTGRAWVVGPEEPDGPMILRMDGFPACFVARPVRPRTGPPRWLPAPAGTTGTAADDPVTASLLARIRRIRTVWLCAALGYAGLSLLVYRFGTTSLDKDFGSVFYPLALVVVLLCFARWQSYRRLNETYRAGPWTRVTVRIGSWQARWHGAAATRGTVHLADDRNLTITVTGASVAVLTAMERTGAVWLAGELRPGQTVIIGYPGYPLFGHARLS